MGQCRFSPGLNALLSRVSSGTCSYSRVPKQFKVSIIALDGLATFLPHIFLPNPHTINNLQSLFCALTYVGFMVNSLFQISDQKDHLRV